MQSVIILALRFHNSLHIPSGIVLFELRYIKLKILPEKGGEGNKEKEDLAELKHI